FATVGIRPPALSSAEFQGGIDPTDEPGDALARAGRVERYLIVECPVAAHRERARAAPRGTELHEPRGDSRLLLGARNPLPDRGGIRGRRRKKDSGQAQNN